MENPKSVTVQKTWLPGGGGWAVVVTAVRTDKQERLCETFTFVIGFPNLLLHYDARRDFFTDAPKAVFSDEDLRKHAGQFAPAPLMHYLFERRKETGDAWIISNNFDLAEGSVLDIAHLYYLDEDIRTKVLEMLHVTACPELAKLIESIGSPRGYIITQDINRH